MRRDLLPEDSELVGRLLVEDIAPDELIYFDEILAAQQRKRHENALGFGVPDGTMVVLTSILVEVGKPILAFVWDHGKESAGKLVKDCSESARVALTKQFRSWLGQKPRGRSPVTLTRHDVSKLMDQLDQTGLTKKLSSQQRAQLADSLHRQFVGSGP